MEILPGQRPLNDAEAHRYATDQVHKHGVSYAEARNEAMMLGHDPNWERALRDLFLKQPCTLFLCCLAERWNSGAMWAMYAAKHTGLAVGFNMKTLPRRVTAGLGKVIYSQERPQMPLLETDHDVLALAAITKSKDWDYQDEWRVVAPTAATEYLKADAVAEIVVAYNADEKLVSRALEFKKNHPATKVYQAFPHPQMHQMDRQELSL